MSRVFLEIDGGRFGHKSISIMIMDDDLSSGFGTRILGEKPWGGGSAEQSYELSSKKIEEIIERLLMAKAELDAR